jgi:DNA-binding transcriptional ArsR family regulator
MTQTETKYKVQSLERGLAILRELREANIPVRNQDLVQRTGLPKATVSRLLSTLGALGYVRRIDQGSYVLAHASARTGRAMLDALQLDRYRALFEGAPAPVYLEAVSGDRLVPVYRWSGRCAGVVANGSPTCAGPTGRKAELDAGEHWDAGAAVWSAWTGFRVDTLGSFVLTLQVSHPAPPAPEEVNQVRGMLHRAAQAITLGTQP